MCSVIQTSSLYQASELSGMPVTHIRLYPFRIMNSALKYATIVFPPCLFQTITSYSMLFSRSSWYTIFK